MHRSLKPLSNSENREEAARIVRGPDHLTSDVGEFMELRLAEFFEVPVLGLGAEGKGSLCLCGGRTALLARGLGNLQNPDCYREYLSRIKLLQEMMGTRPRLVAHDLHPLYLSTQYALKCGTPRFAVQHHHAHMAAVAAEHALNSPGIGICCDGLGYGDYGAALSCEILISHDAQFERLGQLEYFFVPGCDAAAIENWRPAAALLRQAFGTAWRGLVPSTCPGFSEQACALIDHAANQRSKPDTTSSLGRVFDGISFLLGLCERNDTEAAAAIQLEKAASDDRVESYAYETTIRDGRIEMSVAPITRGIVQDLKRRTPLGVISARFHESIARMLAASATLASDATRISNVILSGGSFLNKRILNRVRERLEARHLRVLTPKRVPFGDGNIALGQAVVAGKASKGGR